MRWLLNEVTADILSGCPIIAIGLDSLNLTFSNTILLTSVVVQLSSLSTTSVVIIDTAANT